MVIENLTREEITDYAWEHYKNPQLFSSQEFYEDMQIFFYVKKLISRYKKGSTTNIHLLLNHIITLNNLFGVEACRHICRHYVPSDQHDVLNSVFYFLSILPEDKNKVDIDENVISILESL